jgi:gliding motility-associated-like protein
VGVATITPALCYNQSSGIINMVGTGGTSPYTYAIGAGVYTTNNTFSNILAGSYVIHIKDNNGCMKDTTVTVTQPTVIVPSITFTSPSCFGFSDGTVTVSATGGTPTYNYAIGTGTFSTSTGFTALPAGLDTVYVKDNNGCLYDTIFTITQPTAIHYDSLKLSNIKCFGDNSGWIQVYASGATPAYTYAANAGAFQASSVLTGLVVGPQIIHLQDSHNCLLDTTVTLTQPPHLAFQIDSLLNPTCEGYADGAITFHAWGGTAPYLYSFNDTNAVPYSSNMIYTKIKEGSYLIYIKDANNCWYDTSVQFVGYPHIIIDATTLTSPSCYNRPDGAISLQVSGGMQPLRYQLNAGAFITGNCYFDSIPTGTYIITITDNKNCVKDTSLFLAQPDSIHLSSKVTPNDCEGIDNGGAITITTNGGSAPYAYIWSSNPEVNVPYLSGMPNGNYMVWVKDANGCVDSLLTPILYDDCCKPFIPDAFTPNGDGLNDIFRIRFKGDMKLINLSIYNRFGQRVYSSQYIDQGWDGTYNGVPQDLGTFEYYLKAICGNKGDHVIELKGDITLIR